LALKLKDSLLLTDIKLMLLCYIAILTFESMWQDLSCIQVLLDKKYHFLTNDIACESGGTSSKIV